MYYHKSIATLCINYTFAKEQPREEKMVKEVKRFADVKVAVRLYKRSILPEVKRPELRNTQVEVVISPRGSFDENACDLFMQKVDREGNCSEVTDGFEQLDSIDEALDQVFSYLGESDKEIMILYHETLNAMALRSWMRGHLLSPENQLDFDEKPSMQNRSISVSPKTDTED